MKEITSRIRKAKEKFPMHRKKREKSGKKSFRVQSQIPEKKESRSSLGVPFTQRTSLFWHTHKTLQIDRKRAIFTAFTAFSRDLCSTQKKHPSFVYLCNVGPRGLVEADDPDPVVRGDLGLEVLGHVEEEAEDGHGHHVLERAPLHRRHVAASLETQR